VANCAPQVIERFGCLGLAVDLAVRPLLEADAYAAEAAPPCVVASIAGASVVLANLVQTHGLFLLSARYDTPPSIELCSAVRAGCVPRECRSSQASIHAGLIRIDRKSTRLNSSHEWISYAVFCLKKKIH